jgi:hypothetical protein
MARVGRSVEPSWRNEDRQTRARSFRQRNDSPAGKCRAQGGEDRQGRVTRAPDDVGSHAGWGGAYRGVIDLGGG